MATAYHPLVDEATLHTLRRHVELHGTRIVERVPSASELSSFFHELQTHTDTPLSHRLFRDGDDGTIFIRHTLTSPSNTIQHVHLCTVAHDYTRTSRAPFTQDDHSWPSSSSSSPDAPLATSITPLLDALQRHLLARSPSFFHSASAHDAPNATLVLRTAARAAAHPEPPPEPTATGWRPYGWDAARTTQASIADATLWAVCHLVPTDARADVLRLRHITATARAVFASTVRRPVPAGSALALLAARMPPRHDAYGRARFPVIVAAAADAALLPGLPGAPPPPPPAQTEPRRILPLLATAPQPDPSTVKRGRLNATGLVRVTCSLVFLIVFTAIAAYYSLSDSVQGRNRLVSWILWAIVVISAIELIMHLLTMCMSARATPARSLDAAVRTAAATEGVRFQVDLASSPAAAAVYDGAWLSFNGRRYYGDQQYNGPRFSVAHLLQAGYETTLCMDGREALVAPDGTAVRLRLIDDQGAAVFERAESDASQVPTAVVKGVVATWSADIPVSSQPAAQLYAPAHAGQNYDYV